MNLSQPLHKITTNRKSTKITQSKSDFNFNFSSEDCGFRLKCEKVWMEEDGKSNMREIIKITKQQTI